MWERIKLWWRVKHWRAKDHMDCICFLGACNLCRERLRYLGLPDNPRPLIELTHTFIYGGHNDR